MSDERPILIVNDNEWTPALVAKVERQGFDVKPNRWCPRRTAFIIREPETLLYEPFPIERMLEESVHE